MRGQRSEMREDRRADRERSNNFHFLTSNLYPLFSILYSLFAICYSLFTIPCLYASRSSGVCGTYVASGDDIESIFYNPAGLYNIKTSEIFTSYTTLYPKLTDGSKLSEVYLAAGLPYKGYVPAFGYFLLGGEFYKDETYAFSLSGIYKKIVFGLTAKILRKSIGTDDYSFNSVDETGKAKRGITDHLTGKSKTLFSLDAGILYNISENYKIGLSIKDINQPDMSFENSGDTKKMKSTIGFAMNTTLINLSADFSAQEYSNNILDYVFSFGAERHFDFGEYGATAIRCGMTFGSRELRRFAVGFGHSLKWFGFNYSYIFPLVGIKNSGDIQRISLNMRFGKPPESKKLKELSEKLFTEKSQNEKLLKEVERLENEKDRLKKELESLLASEKEKEEPKAERSPAVEYIPPREISVEKKAPRISTAKSDIDNRKIEFDTSMRYYYQLKDRGISEREKKDILRRIIRKYENTGVDISEAKTELAK